MSHFASGDRLKKCVHVIQLFFKSFLCGDFRHIRMMISVVADDVTFRYHAFGKFRTGFQKISDDKESANRLMVFQGIQNSRQIAIFISGIKGEVNDFFICFICVGCLIFCKLRRRGVADRTHTFFLKTESPVAF